MKLPRDLFLIRHGEIVDPAGREAMSRVQRGETVPGLKLAHGIPPDRGLTKFGQEQVLKISSWLKAVSPQTFEFAENADQHQFWVCEYHPENSRCHETNKFLGVDENLWKESPLLKDRDWGTLGYSMVRDDLRKMHKEYPEPYYWKPSGDGTSMKVLVEQVTEFLESLRREDPLESVFISCHGEVLIAFTVVIRKLSPDDFKLLLRNKQFDMPAGVVAHFSRRQDDNPLDSEEYHKDRLVCPWNEQFSRATGRWETYP